MPCRACWRRSPSCSSACSAAASAARRVGLIAAGLAAVYPQLVMVDGTVITEALYAPLIAAILLLTYRLLDRPRPGSAALLGLAVGAATLTRSEAIFLLVLLVAPAAVIAGRRGRPRRAAGLAARGGHRAGARALGGAQRADARPPDPLHLQQRSHRGRDRLRRHVRRRQPLPRLRPPRVRAARAVREHPRRAPSRRPASATRRGPTCATTPGACRSSSPCGSCACGSCTATRTTSATASCGAARSRWPRRGWSCTRCSCSSASPGWSRCAARARRCGRC